MDKKELRRCIREQKRAMSEEMIVEKSRKLGELFAASELYQNAKTIYGYLPYNQEVRTVAMLEQVEGVESVDAEFELAEGFSTISRVLALVSTGIIVILLIVSLLIISNTVKLAMYDRKNEIAIMKMVGATNGFIRFPFMVQGFFLGILGAGIAFAAEWMLYDALITKIAQMDGMGLFDFVPFQELLVPMIVTFSAAGLFVGIFGSISAIRKFMDV